MLPLQQPKYFKIDAKTAVKNSNKQMYALLIKIYDIKQKRNTSYTV